MINFFYKTHIFASTVISTLHWASQQTTWRPISFFQHKHWMFNYSQMIKYLISVNIINKRKNIMTHVHQLWKYCNVKEQLIYITHHMYVLYFDVFYSKKYFWCLYMKSLLEYWYTWWNTNWKNIDQQSFHNTDLIRDFDPNNNFTVSVSSCIRITAASTILRLSLFTVLPLWIENAQRFDA